MEPFNLIAAALMIVAFMYWYFNDEISRRKIRYFLYHCSNGITLEYQPHIGFGFAVSINNTPHVTDYTNLAQEEDILAGETCVTVVD